ncbi:TPA: hypothetical protein ACH3X1_004878 [Trebouxia sp. C0004]
MSSARGWAMPKFHLMRMWPATIRAFGSANVTSTGFGERSHVILKDCFRLTNRHSAEAVDEQTLVNASRKRTAETMAADAEAAEPSVEKRSSSAAQKACETGCTCLSSGRTGMVYVGSTDTTAISVQLPNHPHILLLLQRALGSYLAGPQGTVPSLVADMPRTVDRKVWVSTGLGIAHQLHCGSSKEGVMLSAGDCVRVRGDSPAEVWYAELLLLFSFKTRGPIEPEVALVRWFAPVPRPAHARSIRLQPFQQAKVKLTGIQQKVFHVDVVTLASILGPCFMQPDPINSNIFYYNHWVGNTAIATG